MTAANFDRCLAEVLRHEGGLVDDPKDPGGLTNFGVSQRSYPQENIRGMTKERAAAIYRKDYWARVRGDDLPDGIDLATFDAAVNSGPKMAVKWLQRALLVKPDGEIGPTTVEAARRSDPATTIRRMCEDRLGFLRALKTWPHFGKGWQRRVDSVQTVALGMVGAGAPEPWRGLLAVQDARIAKLERQMAKMAEAIIGG